MHPASTLQLLPVPRAMAAAGVDVLCAGSRYARNDTPLIMEMAAADLGAYVRHAREVWAYDHVVLAGWSGGGSLSVFYQSQAESAAPLTQTPAGDQVDFSGLLPADAIIYHAAHLSRAVVLSEFIDPSVLDESNPDIRDTELDLYDPRNPNQPPYTPEFLARFRAAQLDRIRRRTAYVRELLSPAGIARYSTLRAWLSQWSIDDTNAQADRNITGVHMPLLAIENSADDAVPQSHVSRVYEASPAAVKDYMLVKGANHYYADQPHHLQDVANGTVDWLARHQLA
jgi:hypothetical protein